VVERDSESGNGHDAAESAPENESPDTPATED